MYSALVLPVCTTVPQYDTFGTVVQTIAVQVQYIDGTYVLCYYYRYVLPYRSMILSVPQYQSWYRIERQRATQTYYWHCTGTRKGTQKTKFRIGCHKKDPPRSGSGRSLLLQQAYVPYTLNSRWPCCKSVGGRRRSTNTTTTRRGLRKRITGYVQYQVNTYLQPQYLRSRLLQAHFLYVI